MSEIHDVDQVAPKREHRWKHADKRVVHFISKVRWNPLTHVMTILTRIGDGWLWFVLTIAFYFVNINAGLAFTFALVIQIILQIVMKKIFSRERPYIKHEDITNLMLPPDRFSFPSGHTAGAFAMTFVFYYFYPVMFIPFLVLSLMIGISRMYLGLHYPTDVLAGMVVGYVSARLSVVIVLLIDLKV